MRRWCLALFIASCFATSVAAADAFSFFRGSGALAQTVKPCSFESLSTTRPNVAEGGTQVQIGVRVLDLIEIDDVKQAMTLDFVLFARWQDDAVARQLAGQRSCQLALHSVWNPGLRVVGERELHSKLEEVVVVASDASVTYMQRFIGSLRATANLRAFPIDSRTLRIRIVAPGYGPQEVQFVPDSAHTGLEPDPSVTNWVLDRETSEVVPYSVENLGELASFTFSIEARRRPNVYAWRLGIPILLIVLMSWLPFWIPPTEVGARNSLASLAMLNMIAFQVVLRSMLPPVPYLTRADWISTAALILIFLALVESAATGVLELRGKSQRAGTINRISRLAFPVVALGLVLIFLLSF